MAIWMLTRYLSLVEEVYFCPYILCPPPPFFYSPLSICDIFFAFLCLVRGVCLFRRTMTKRKLYSKSIFSVAKAPIVQSRLFTSLPTSRGMVHSSITDHIDCHGAKCCNSNLPYPMLMKLSGQTNSLLSCVVL